MRSNRRSKRIFFSEDGSRKFIVEGDSDSLNHFGLGQLNSTEIFPFRNYSPEKKKEENWVLMAKHIHRNRTLEVSVWTASN